MNIFASIPCIGQKRPGQAGTGLHLIEQAFQPGAVIGRAQNIRLPAPALSHPHPPRPAHYRPDDIHGGRICA
jgi:hypothetical protein